MLNARSRIQAFALSLISAIACPMAAQAQCNGYYCSAVIQSMTVAEFAVYVQLAGGLSGLTNCTPYSTSYITLPRDNPNFKDYYATLLGAYLAKQSVTLRPLDSSPNCSIAYIALP